MNTLRVAVVQHAPVYFDLDASLARFEALLAQLAEQQVQLACFGETWLTGYPAFLDHLPNVALWDHGPTKAVFARMLRNALRIPSPEYAHLCRLVAQAGVAVVLGANEASATGTLYNSLLVLNTRGELQVHHRKLMPTYTERMLYGLGDGFGLRTAQVGGLAVGGLICWEHWMPLARQAMHQAGEHLHVAVWPTVHDMHQVASRQYAFEGRCFVAAAGQLLRASDLPPELELPEALRAAPNQLLLRGGSCIIHPRGHYLAPPVYDTEALLVADIALDEALQERMTLDVAGHYSRPDVFDYQINRNRSI